VVAVVAVAQPGALWAAPDGAEAATKTTSDPMRTKRRRIDPTPFPRCRVRGNYAFLVMGELGNAAWGGSLPRTFG
jgi:hypothetical protein